MPFASLPVSGFSFQRRLDQLTATSSIRVPSDAGLTTANGNPLTSLRELPDRGAAATQRLRTRNHKLVRAGTAEVRFHLIPEHGHRLRQGAILNTLTCSSVGARTPTVSS